MFHSKKRLLFLLGIAYFVASIQAFKIKSTSINPNRPVQVGGTVRLSCTSDSDYEYCIWRHKNRVCNFEWKRSHGAVKKQTCTELNDRALFVGSYKNKECAIELKNVQLSDGGDWSCEMESYVWGVVRGYTHKKSLSLNVEPKTFPTQKSPQPDPKTSTSFPTTMVPVNHIISTSQENDTMKDNGEIESASTPSSGMTTDIQSSKEKTSDTDLTSEDVSIIGNITFANKTKVYPLPEENDIKARHNLPLNGKDNQDKTKPPVLAIVLTSLCVIFMAVVVVVIWVYSRRRKENDVIELRWSERLSSNKEVYDDSDISKQLREKSETKCILEDDVSDDNDEGSKVYNGSTVLSFHSNA